MSTFFAEIQQTLYPRHDTKDGPLPPMLVALTVVTGLVDSFSFLVLGHVFVANMTGNVVFLAFALAGVKGFSIALSLISVGSFILGGLVGGLIGSHLGQNRGRMLSFSTAIQAIFVGIAAVLALLSGNPVPQGYGYLLVIVLATSMGIQNAAARKLAVADLTTTVLTLTITGMGADSRVVGGSGSRAGRRLTSICAMIVGALIGALMILYVPIGYPLVIALVVIATVAATARLLSRGSPTWVSPK